ncbi:NAD-glutamate dehydrogenase [Nakamurella deserti]|uniref:NAD-glutamate dehydrogenase n=1 Tax=Nakamurella deserti TaxID=2164074 RepID=UPI000DBE011D|nr:NAD-glutamate dehydrogenase [Nakamurella deserti]
MAVTDETRTSNAAVREACALRPDIATTIGRYFRHVAVEDLPDSAADVVAIVAAHQRLARNRVPGESRIRLFNPQSTGDRWSADSTVIDLVNDDMPYLVDSVISALAAAGAVVHRVLHPILEVRRDPGGALVEVLGGSHRSGHRSRDVLAESWMHVLIDRITDAERAERIEAEVAAVLAQVRHVVEDSTDLAELARATATDIRRNPPHRPAQEIIETADLLDWLTEGNLTFLGAQQYDQVAGDERLVPEPDTGLGLLRDNTDPDGFTAAIGAPHDLGLMMVSKASAVSPLAKNLPPFYLAVRLYDDRGEPVGELRFLGILTARALNADVTATPVLRRVVDQVLLAVGATPESYNGQRALDLLTGYPRAELFWAPVDSIVGLVRSILQSIARRQLRLFLQADPFGRFIDAMVYLPRDRYTTTARLAMQDELLARLHGSAIRHTARIGDSALAAVHFIVTTDPAERVQLDDDSVAALTEAVRRTIRTWEDELAAGVLRSSVSAATAAAVADNGGDISDLDVDDADIDEVLDTAGERSRYSRAFDAAYKEDYSSAEAVVDLHRLDGLRGPDDIALALSDAPGEQAGNRRLKIYVTGATITLSRALPLLQSLGAVVIDENPYQVTRSDGTPSRIYDFGLQLPEAYLARAGVGTDEGQVAARNRVTDAFTAAWNGRAEVDGLNELVLAAGLDWRQVTVFRAYAKYLRQIGTPYTQGYLESVLVSHAAIAGQLAALFAVRFDPERYAADDAGAAARAAENDRLAAAITENLDAVTSLDADRILRTYLQLILGTVRTNAHRRGADGAQRDFWAFKLAPQRIPSLPKPVPAHEIWVYSPWVEGVHLRFGDIARGGLRWSDRPEDFRTEVLGLVKAQEVKNAVIVPVGAKGGFVVKQPPAATGDPVADREAFVAEGVRCYRMFIQALLDVTDNRSGTTIVAPRQVVRHDSDDSYLVVAADKGTATFSDIANAVAVENGFWLGDAFASGGSAGYDHKKMGITARGAWESVKQHFHELDVDTQAEDFTVVGVGDMSGDVFGNGMLLSEHIRLVAAFDHRHVFVDPDPDAAASHAERRRLFDLPRSSWADYDPGLISDGGGVWPRTVKSIPVSGPMRAALGLAADVTSMAPAELIHAVLLAPVDLLFNGGVGTYVKASTESHAQVGDKANDAVRVDGGELRVRVVGEGGNLGVTQLGRIEFARAGGRINTDAIDNSAGVDTSDHEVNIKIALQTLHTSQTPAGEPALTPEQRDAFLFSMTDEVAQLVLADNIAQNRLLSISRQHAEAMISVHARLIDELVAGGRLDRKLEFLPSATDIGLRQAAGGGLTSPELSVLVAYVKSGLARTMLASELPDDPAFAGRLPSYFPAAMRERFPAAIAAHPLRREIVTTMAVNHLVNGAGITFAFRLGEEMATGPTDAVRVYEIATAVYQLPELWEEIAGRSMPAAAQNQLVLLSRRLLDRAARWLLVRRPQPLDVQAEIGRYATIVGELSRSMPRLLCGSEFDKVHTDAAELRALGTPPDLALRMVYALYTFSLLDITDVAGETGRDPAEVAQLYYALSEHIGLDRILSSVSALDRGDRWHSLARQAIRDGLYTSVRAITADVLSTTGADLSAADKIAQWEGENRFRLERARITLGQIATSGVGDLAALSVAAREIRSMAR